MKLSALIAPLIAAKAPHDQIMAVVQAYEAQQEDALERRRAADAERQARKREKDASSRDVTLRHSDGLLVRDRVAPVDDKLKPIDTNTSQNTTSKDHAEFRGVLASLDADRLNALVKHRKSKKAQITGHAARLFLKDVADCGITLSEAVDTCISRNWITVKADWLAKPSARGSPSSSRAPTAAEILKARREQRQNEDDYAPPGTPRLIASR